MTPWGKTKIPNPYCISARHAISYSLVSILYSWKIRCSSSGKLYRKKKRRFSTSIWPLEKKWKFRNPVTRKTRPFPEYYLSILWNVDRVPVTTTSPLTSFVGHWSTPGAKMKVLKPYCASAKHTQSDPIIQFGCDFRCRRSSSDKKFFGWTYGRTDRGNNNIPELSSESAGIKIYYSRTSGHLNPTWDKASVGEENASLFKWRTITFFKER